jgi:hypothetical protein
LRSILGNGEHGFVLADNGYPLREYIVPPVLYPTTEAEEKFNTAHTSMRSTVERLNGMLKKRLKMLYNTNLIHFFLGVAA